MQAMDAMIEQIQLNRVIAVQIIWHCIFTNRRRLDMVV